MITSFYRTLLGHVPSRDGARKASIFFGLLLGSLVPAAATTYYIDPAGSDANNGTSTSTPWQNFTNVNAMTLSPGDQVLLKRGATWNQWLQIHGSGTSSNFITIGAYGSGARPKIQRSTTASNTDVAARVADRCITTYDVSYVKIEHLEVCNAGAGIVIHYDHTYDNQSVYLDDIVAHDFYGIRFNAIAKGPESENKDPTLPSDEYYFRGTNGWEGVSGAGNGPNYPNYYSTDHVTTSGGIVVTGAWDAGTHLADTILNDFRVTNSEFYHSACAVASDWNHWTDREYMMANGGHWAINDRNKLTNFVWDNLNVHDIDEPWVSCGGLLIGAANGGVIKNSRFYKAAYFATGGTTVFSCYNSTDLLFDNVTLQTVPVPTVGTTDMSIMDIGGCYGTEIRNSTFENVAGYGFSFLHFSTGVNTGLNFHNNTFINVDWHWKNILEVFHTVNSSDPDNKPSGTIHTNQLIYAPNVALTDSSGRWTDTTFYENDTIANIHGGLDLARGKTATASAVFGTGYEASKATDGNESTYWATPYSTDQTQWLQIDLGAVKAFNEILINWQSPSYALSYEDQVSQDGVTWETVLNRELTANTGTTDDVFYMRKARYIRISTTLANTAANNPPNYGIYAVRVYSTENFALGVPSTATSTTTAARFTPDYGNDGNDSSMWVSGVTSSPVEYKVDLGSARYINEVRTNWGPSYAKNYTVQVSTDDVNWTVKETSPTITSEGITRDVFSRVSARYVKLVMTAGHVTGATDYSIREMRVFGARNLAMDQAASASTTTTTLGYDAWRALDANDNTRWSSYPGPSPAWFKVDLGQSMNMNEFITAWDTAYAKDYTIQTSNDDITYTTRASPATKTAAGTTYDRLSSPVSARYVKINMTQGYRADPTNYSIKSFQVNYDMARGATCSASTTHASYPLANAVDGDDTTRFSTTVTSGTQWFKVDLGASQNIDRVIMNWDTAYAKDYTIAVSSDDSTYTTVVTRAGVRAAGVTDDKFDASVMGRYVKVTMTKGYVADPVNYSIKTINIYGVHP